jgi:hypothetical protein
VLARDSLKLLVAPLPREMFRTPDSELDQPWSTEE